VEPRYRKLLKRKTDWEYTIKYSKDAEKVSQAKRAIEQQASHFKIAKLAFDSYDGMAKFSKWLLNGVKTLIEAHVDAAAALGSDLIKIKHIVEVETHGHPVQGRESVDSVRVKHVQLLDDAKTGAYKAVGMDALWNVTMVITDLMIFSPAGFSKAVFNKYLKKETAQWFINMAKNLNISYRKE